jgi:hypothetical protein
MNRIVIVVMVIWVSSYIAPKELIVKIKDKPNLERKPLD